MLQAITVVLLVPMISLTFPVAVPNQVALTTAKVHTRQAAISAFVIHGRHLDRNNRRGNDAGKAVVRAIKQLSGKKRKEGDTQANIGSDSKREEIRTCLSSSISSFSSLIFFILVRSRHFPRLSVSDNIFPVTLFEKFLTVQSFLLSFVCRGYI